MRRWREYPRAFVLTMAAGSLVVTAGAAAAAVIPNGGGDQPFGHEQVGQNTPHGLLLPSNQYLTPIGTRTLITDGRLLSSTLAPDGTEMAALSWKDFSGFLSVFNVKTGKLLQQVHPSAADGTVAADGPYYSPATGSSRPGSAGLPRSSTCS